MQLNDITKNINSLGINTSSIQAALVSRLRLVFTEQCNLISNIKNALDAISDSNHKVIDQLLSNTPSISKPSKVGTPDCNTCQFLLPLIKGEKGICRCLLSDGVINNKADIDKCNNYRRHTNCTKGEFTLPQLSKFLGIHVSDIVNITETYNISITEDNFWGESRAGINGVYRFYFNNRAALVIYLLNVTGEWKLHKLISSYNNTYKIYDIIPPNEIQTIQSVFYDLIKQEAINTLDKPISTEYNNDVIAELLDSIKLTVKSTIDGILQDHKYIDRILKVQEIQQIPTPKPTTKRKRTRSTNKQPLNQVKSNKKTITKNKKNK